MSMSVSMCIHSGQSGSMQTNTCSVHLAKRTKKEGVRVRGGCMRMCVCVCVCVFVCVCV